MTHRIRLLYQPPHFGGLYSVPAERLAVASRMYSSTQFTHTGTSGLASRVLGSTVTGTIVWRRQAHTAVSASSPSWELGKACFALGGQDVFAGWSARPCSWLCSREQALQLTAGFCDVQGRCGDPSLGSFPILVPSRLCRSRPLVRRSGQGQPPLPPCPPIHTTKLAPQDQPQPAGRRYVGLQAVCR